MIMQERRNVFRKAAHSLVIMKIYIRESVKLVFHVFLSLKSGLRYFTRGMKYDKYCIKVNYYTRKKYVHFDATKSSEEYQDKVYKGIQTFFKENNLSSVLDIGCGSGFKLMKYFSEYETTGLELPPALDELKVNYPQRNWSESNFNNPPQKYYDLVMSIDVIEHLLEPDVLMEFISKLNFKYIALGTPDRSKLPVFSKFGPPWNKHHIREWSRQEFVNYAGKYFNVILSEVVNGHEHFIVAEKINSPAYKVKCDLNMTELSFNY